MGLGECVTLVKLTTAAGMGAFTAFRGSIALTGIIRRVIIN